MFLNGEFIPGDYPIDSNASAMSDQFMAGRRPRYLFGRNAYAADIARQVDIDGFIDDFTTETSFMGRPIVSLDALPPTAIVVSAVVGVHPITVRRRLVAAGIDNIDYFAFQRYSGLALKEVMFMGEAQTDLEVHREAYAEVYARLADTTSRETYKALVCFRLTRNLDYLDGFTDAQDVQYFEPFLQLAPQGEIFLDVGCYDGFTSAEFIRRCPDYAGVHVFEPDPNNMRKVRDRLLRFERIHYHPYGAASAPARLRFQSNGSASGICDDGDQEIRVERIDDVVPGPFTFLKMDIEGGEIPALQGAAEAIRHHHPRLAVSAYHRADDLWRIPQAVFHIRDDYDLYLRHYTEGVTETVLFFVPRP